MITIVLPVSRPNFLEKVITNLELLECDQTTTNLLCIVDGNDELFIKARNLVVDTKFNERLVVKSELENEPPKIDVQTRRKRIAAIHNQARKLIKHEDGFVFLCEDDTTFPTDTLKRLSRLASMQRAFGMAEGVELGRWGTPYVGAWTVNDIYDIKQLKSVENLNPIIGNPDPVTIDAGGLYCTLARADLYKMHEFTSENGLGPDVNFGLELRQMGYQNFLIWQIQCAHHYVHLKEEKVITPDQDSRVVTITHRHGSTWHVAS